MIHRGHVYEVQPPRGDPKPRRYVLVLSADARNRSAAIETVIAVPFTTKIRRLPWRVSFPKRAGGLPARSEAACELVGQWRKSHFRPMAMPHPLGGSISTAQLVEVLEGIKVALGY